MYLARKLDGEIKVDIYQRLNYLPLKKRDGGHKADTVERVWRFTPTLGVEIPGDRQPSHLCGGGVAAIAYAEAAARAMVLSCK